MVASAAMDSITGHTGTVDIGVIQTLATMHHIGELAMVGIIHITTTDITAMDTAIILTMATITTTVIITMEFPTTAVEEIQITLERNQEEDPIMFQHVIPIVVQNFQDV